MRICNTMWCMKRTTAVDTYAHAVTHLSGHAAPVAPAGPPAPSPKKKVRPSKVLPVYTTNKNSNSNPLKVSRQRPKTDDFSPLIESQNESIIYIASIIPSNLTEDIVTLNTPLTTFSVLREMNGKSAHF